MDHQTSEPSSIVVRTERGLAIRGTRVTLYNILDGLAAQWPAKLIQDRYSLSEVQIAAALTYIAEHQAAVYAEYAQVLQEAEEARQYWEERNRLERTPSIVDTPERAAFRAKLAAAKARHAA